MNAIIKKRMQRLGVGCADWLAAKTKNSSRVKKKIALLLFCAAFTGASIYIMTQTALGYGRQEMKILIHQNYPQRHIGKNIDPALPGNIISDDLYKKIELLKSSDSLLLARPGLADTIQMIEQIYRSQSKK